jgi:ABC-type transport system involved in cytochrome c biogenesis permease component
LAILIVAAMAVAFVAAALTGMLEIERVFEMLPPFEDLIGD